MPGFDYISLTTDYGLSDGFVAACHGVIARAAPAVKVIDVTHLIAPGDVTRAAAILAQTVPHLPPAVHVAVVDPGVGTSRRAVALDCRAGGVLVGPDNGVLMWAATVLGGVDTAYELSTPDDASRTFHGRDVFAPAAARIALGAAQLTQQIDPSTLITLPDPVVAVGDGWIEAEVLTIDRFGNVQLAASAELLRQLPDSVTVGGCRAVRGETFADAAHGGLVVFGDSADRVAIAVNGGRAAVMLAVTPGDILRIS
ncbi:SAM hydrolase/SAM-dependent halogenase family protein [Allorhizocola rhizosphaerae]|uniref:SAM hydrolase/SAM-dependent halogenase family protein n=1 Tax=Allorhizocola rhizosphaerae TaxID=1872709 RepID=UPI000E3CD6DD|nr:SAM-dependent chlorinase/fluorinase [Allorhizocola rhizosphaerae]